MYLAKTLSIIMILVLSLTAVGCSGTSVLTDIQAVLDGIAALQGELPLAGVSPAIAKAIGDYASAAATGVGQCAALLAMGGDTTTLVAKCGAYLTAAVKPVLPPGTAQNIVGLVNLIYEEIQVVYTAIEAGQKGSPVSTNKLSIPTTWHPSYRYAGKLRAMANQAAILAKR